MKKEVSIVKVDKRNYRAIARENWGLTREQMKGKHVHHRIKRSEGGTNDPCNLYVCSEWFHDNVWHAEEGGFTGCASKGGRKGGLARPKEVARACGLKAKESGQLREAAIKGGQTTGPITGKMPFWNNGEKSVRSHQSPGEGWVRGQAEKWWKNGSREVKQVNCPGEGWVRGRLRSWNPWAGKTDLG